MARTEICEEKRLRNDSTAPLPARVDERALFSALQQVGEGVLVFDLEGRLLWGNTAALAMHGCHSVAEWRSWTDLDQHFELSTLNGQVLPFDEWPMARLLNGEAVREMTLRVRRLEPAWSRDLIFRGSAAADGNGRPLALLLVTEADRSSALEQKLAERAAELADANEELELFAYSISHDLRAPLRTIDGFSHALVEDYGAIIPEEGQVFLSTIRKGVQRLNSLIEDLLRFSRLNRQPIEMAEVDMARIARVALDELPAQRAGRSIDFVFGELPAAWGDSSLLRQVWLQLLSNALKFTHLREHATIEIGFSVSSEGQPAYFVRDNGVGFDMRYLEKLFGVFRRLHRAEEYPGNGIGLAIVQRIVRRHGGRAWAVGEAGHGATFFFSLPASSPPSD